MRRIWMLVAALLLPAALAGCGGGGAGAIPTSPAAVADGTVLDEKAAITAETAYTAASTLGLRLAEAGIIDRAKFKAADERAYRATLLVRGAYITGNAETFASAISQVNDAVAEIRELAKRE